MINNLCEKLNHFCPLNKRKRTITINTNDKKDIEQWSAFDKIILEKIDSKFNKPLLRRHQSHSRINKKDSSSLVKFENPLLNLLNTHHYHLISQEIVKGKSSASLPMIDSNINDTISITKLIDNKEKETVYSIVSSISNNKQGPSLYKCSSNSNNEYNDNVSKHYFDLSHFNHENKFNYNYTKEPLPLKRIFTYRDHKTNKSNASTFQLTKRFSSSTLQPILNKNISFKKGNKNYVKRINFFRSQDHSSLYNLADCDHSISSMNGLMKPIYQNE